MKRASILQKTLDRAIGIPLVFFLSSMLVISRKIFQKTYFPREPKNVGILCLAAIGDLVLLSAPIKDFKKKYPQAKITLFCGPDNFTTAALIDSKNTVFSEVIELNHRQPLKAFMQMRRKTFDLLIDAGQWARWSALMSLVAKSSWKVGFKTKGQGRHWGFDQKIMHGRDRHEIDNFHSLFHPWNPHQNSWPTLSVPPSSDINSKPTVVCHLFASGTSSWQKELPPEEWEIIFQKLEEKGFQIVLTGGPQDQVHLKELFSSEILKGKTDLVGKSNLKETLAVLEKAKAVISVNTGIMHLAAALDIPLVAIHGPTNFKRWGPLSKKAISLTSTLSCSPCLNLGFDYKCPLNSCMKTHTAENILSALYKAVEIQ